MSDSDHEQASCSLPKHPFNMLLSSLFSAKLISIRWMMSHKHIEVVERSSLQMKDLPYDLTAFILSLLDMYTQLTGTLHQYSFATVAHHWLI
jgi:hypothetical protein